MATENKQGAVLPKAEAFERIAVWSAYAVACLALPLVVFGPEHSWWQSLLIALVLFVIGNASRLVKFSVSLTGVSAELRQAVREARDLMPELRRLAITALRGTLGNALSAGRTGSSIANTEYDRMRADVLAVVKSLHGSPADIEFILAAERPWVLVDYSLGIRRRAQRLVSPEHDTEWDKFRRQDSSGLKKASAAELRAILERINAIDEELRELLEDFAHYERTGEQRRPEAWARRDQWMRGE